MGRESILQGTITVTTDDVNVIAEMLQFDFELHGEKDSNGNSRGIFSENRRDSYEDESPNFQSFVDRAKTLRNNDNTYSLDCYIVGRNVIERLNILYQDLKTDSKTTADFNALLEIEDFCPEIDKFEYSTVWKRVSRSLSEETINEIAYLYENGSYVEDEEQNQYIAKRNSRPPPVILT